MADTQEGEGKKPFDKGNALGLTEAQYNRLTPEEQKIAKRTFSILRRGTTHHICQNPFFTPIRLSLARRFTTVNKMQSLRLIDIGANLTDERFQLLHYACVWHTDGGHHDDPTIGTCWDVDQLDPGRVGVIQCSR